jgi:hypothetical protein
MKKGKEFIDISTKNKLSLDNYDTQIQKGSMNNFPISSQKSQ